MSKLFRYKQIRTIGDKWERLSVKVRNSRGYRNKYYLLCINALDYRLRFGHPMWRSNTEKYKQMRKEFKETARENYKELIRELVEKE